MLALMISISMLLLSPLLFMIAIQFQKVWMFLEKILGLVIAAIVVLHLIPDSIALSGWKSLALAFLGLFLPIMMEKSWHKKAHSIHFFALIIGVLGLAMHGVMDGAALAMSSVSRGGLLLPLSIVVHNLPLGILIYSVFYPEYGFKLPSFFTLALIVAMVLGYMGGTQFFSLRENIVYVGLFQAFIAGSLLHVVFDRHDDEHDHVH